MGVTPLFSSLKNSGLTLRPFFCFFGFLTFIHFHVVLILASIFYVFVFFFSSVLVDEPIVR